jgi:hypothetical protein
VSGDTLNMSFWLAFDRHGYLRLSRGEPSLAANERAIAMSAQVPLSLFRTPNLSGTLTITAPEHSPPVIDVSAAEDALKAVIGCDVVLSVRDAE